MYPVVTNPAWFEVRAEFFDHVDVYRIPAKDELDAYVKACKRAELTGYVVT